MRTGRVGTDKLLEFRGEDKVFPDDAWVAAPVKKGSLVLIHGQVILLRNYIWCQLKTLQVVHKSAKNLSENPRHAYTFHVIEMEGSHYASKNWLQPTKEMPLPKLYSPSRKA